MKIANPGVKVSEKNEPDDELDFTWQERGVLTFGMVVAIIWIAMVIKAVLGLYP